MAPSAVVLFGGSSSERKVSVASAQNIVSTLSAATPWFMTPTGEVRECSAKHLLAHQRPFEMDFQADGARKGSSLREAVASVSVRDTVFVLALHGGAGEDGTVQRTLEDLKAVFTGSSSEASRNAFDKVVAKQMVAKSGLKVAPAEVLLPGADVLGRMRAFAEKSPQFVAKPVADGSSVGVFRIDAQVPLETLAQSIRNANVAYLLEPFLKGRELTVGVVEEPRGPVALPVSEVRLEAASAFDYDAKYLGRGAKEITADLPAQLASEAKRYGVVAHEALGCTGYSRTDLIATEDGIYFLETNTLPGLTRASFIPQQLEADHRTMRAFLDLQIAIALRRSLRR